VPNPSPAHERLLSTQESINALTFSPDGKMLATAGMKTIELWDTQTAKLTKTLSGNTGSLQWLAFSPDGRKLASASATTTTKDKNGAEVKEPGRTKIWDVETATPKLTLDESPDSRWVAFSPDGKYLAAWSTGERDKDTSIKIWDISTGKLKNSLTGDKQEDLWVRPTAFSSDG